VTGGTFTYRTTQGTAVLAPGATLLGNHGHCFECGHEHGIGDRCLSFRFNPELVESVLSELAGARQPAFTLPNLPPLPQLIPLVADAAAARDGSGAISFEELALSVVAEVRIVLSGMSSSMRGKQFARHPSPRDQRRVTEALRRIEAHCDSPLSLQHLATEVAMSPYHFLRTFRAVAGMSPHQYLLHTRLNALPCACAAPVTRSLALRWRQDSATCPHSTDASGVSWVQALAPIAQPDGGSRNTQLRMGACATPSPYA